MPSAYTNIDICAIFFVCRHQTGWLGLRNLALRSYRSLGLRSSSDAPAEDSLPLLGTHPPDPFAQNAAGEVPHDACYALRR